MGSVMDRMLFQNGRAGWSGFGPLFALFVPESSKTRKTLQNKEKSPESRGFQVIFCISLTKKMQVLYIKIFPSFTFFVGVSNINRKIHNKYLQKPEVKVFASAAKAELLLHAFAGVLV